MPKGTPKSGSRTYHGDKQKKVQDAFTKNLNTAMEIYGDTQKTLADSLGADRSTISKWTTGRAMPALDYFWEICQRYGKSADWMLSPHGSAEMLPSQKYTTYWEEFTLLKGLMDGGIIPGLDSIAYSATLSANATEQYGDYFVSFLLRDYKKLSDSSAMQQRIPEWARRAEKDFSVPVISLDIMSGPRFSMLESGVSDIFNAYAGYVNVLHAMQQYEKYWQRYTLHGKRNMDIQKETEWVENYIAEFQKKKETSI